MGHSVINVLGFETVWSHQKETETEHKYLFDTETTLIGSSLQQAIHNSIGQSHNHLSKQGCKTILYSATPLPVQKSQWKDITSLPGRMFSKTATGTIAVFPKWQVIQ